MPNQPIPAIPNNYAYLVQIKGNLQTAFADLLHSGHVTLTEVSPHALSELVDHMADPASDLTQAIVHLLDAASQRNVPTNGLFSVGLRLSGKQPSGFPYFSIQWMERLPLSEPTQKDAEKSDTISQDSPAHPAFSTPPTQPSPLTLAHRNRARILQSTSGLPLVQRQKCLTDVLVDTLVDNAAATSSSPEEFQTKLRSEVEKTIATIEQQLGLA